MHGKLFENIKKFNPRFGQKLFLPPPQVIFCLFLIDRAVGLVQVQILKIGVRGEHYLTKMCILTYKQWKSVQILRRDSFRKE